MVLCVISVWGRELGQGGRLSHGSAALDGVKAMGQMSFTLLLWGSPALWDQGWGTGALLFRLGTRSSADVERSEGMHIMGGTWRGPCLRVFGVPGQCAVSLGSVKCPQQVQRVPRSVQGPGSLTGSRSVQCPEGLSKVPSTVQCPQGVWRVPGIMQGPLGSVQGPQGVSKFPSSVPRECAGSPGIVQCSQSVCRIPRKCPRSPEAFGVSRQGAVSPAVCRVPGQCVGSPEVCSVPRECLRSPWQV